MRFIYVRRESVECSLLVAPVIIFQRKSGLRKKGLRLRHRHKLLFTGKSSFKHQYRSRPQRAAIVGMRLRLSC